MPYFVDMLASRRHGTLYVGVTDDLGRRVWAYEMKIIEGFTARYDVSRLVWALPFDDVGEAISYEKRTKKWRRDGKIRIVEEENPNWVDLMKL